MDKVVIGLFDNRKEVEDTLEKLKTRGFDPKDISIVLKNKEEAKEIQGNTGSNVAGGAVSGATTGAVIGGIAGLLAATVIPGIGAFLIGGPIAAALGLGGVAASTFSGATTGALAGGLIGALMGFGLNRKEAEHYETRVKEGAILVAVPVSEERDVSYVERVFQENRATDIKVASKRENSSVKKDNGRGHSAGDDRGIRKHHTRVNPVQMQKYLVHVDYPATREELVESAKEKGADDTVIDTLMELPEKKFKAPTEVSREIGKFK